MGTLLQLGAIGVGLFLWGCLLLAIFDRLLALLERDWVRWSLAGLLLALPFGLLAAFTHSVMDEALAFSSPDFVTAGSVTSTWIVSTLAAWAGAIQLFRWRALRARQARQSSTPRLPSARTC